MKQITKVRKLYFQNKIKNKSKSIRYEPNGEVSLLTITSEDIRAIYVNL